MTAKRRSSGDPVEDQITRLHQALADARTAERAMRGMEAKYKADMEAFTAKMDKAAVAAQQSVAAIAVTLTEIQVQRVKGQLDKTRDTVLSKMADFIVEAQGAWAQMLGCENHEELVDRIAERVKRSLEVKPATYMDLVDAARAMPPEMVKVRQHQRGRR